MAAFFLPRAGDDEQAERLHTDEQAPASVDMVVSSVCRR